MNEEKINDGVFTRICPVCKKMFVPAPQHVYRQNHDAHGRLVCSWKCACAEKKPKGKVIENGI